MAGKIAAFGEIMLRLAAAHGENISDSRSFDACYGGTEANVLACLSGLGHDTKYITALPDTELGRGALEHLRGYGIDTSDIAVGGEFLGVYFSSDGTGSRGADVVYYRKFSEFAKLDTSSFDFDKVFDGVSLFHISGISFALSESSRALAFELMREARARKITVSFDFNYRSRLWTVERARPVLKAAAELADIVLASDLDLSTFMNVSARDYFDRFGGRYLILRNRKALGANRHSVRVSAYSRGEFFETGELVFPVVEKIGGGDAFDGGMLHALASGFTLADAVKFGVAAFMLKHSVKGDTLYVPADAIEEREREVFGN